MVREAPMIAAGCVTLAGLVILIVGIILISVGAPNEIPMWYGITNCLCTGVCDAPEASAAGSILWQGTALRSSDVCPASFSKFDAKPQTFELQQIHFSMDGLEYKPVVYRTDLTTSISFDIKSEDGKETYLSVPTQQLHVAKDDSPIVIVNNEEMEEEGDESADPSEGAPQSAKRKLAKGGRAPAASGPVRTRQGNVGRYGSGTSAYRTRYGRSSCCISYGTVVYVNRDGPRTRNGYYDSDEDIHTDCTDATKGCAYETAKDFQRDELEQFSLVPVRAMKWPLKLTVYNSTIATTTPPPYEPELYLTFWTEDPDDSTVSSYVLLPLGSLLLIGPWLALLFV